MPKYARSAGKDVEREMKKYKKGTLRSGKGGKGGKVKSRKQAIAIGLSEARKEGKKVSKKSGSRKSSSRGGSRSSSSKSGSGSRSSRSRKSSRRSSSK